MSRAYLAFTAKGEALAHRLAEALPGSVSRCGGDVTLKGWTAEHFAQDEALIFVGAVGIAVRAIAPHCRSKAADPAVVVLDEGGRFAIPLLSGHLGGANELAQRLAAVCHAVPVITTATDGRGVFCRGRVGQAPELRRGRAGAHPLRERGTVGRAERLLCRRLGCFRHAASGCGACRRR